MMRGELPLRIVDQPGGPVIRCLCGAEAAVIRPVSDTMAGLIRINRGSAAVVRGISPDQSSAAVLRMAVHAKHCQHAARALERSRP